MSRRLLSTAVQIKPAPKDVLLIPRHLLGQVLVPTDAEMRDAIGRCTRDLENMRLSRGPTWEADISTLNFSTQLLDTGEVVLRGSVVIERADG